MTRGRRARQSRFHRSHARQSVGIRGAFPPSGDGGYTFVARVSMTPDIADRTVACTSVTFHGWIPDHPETYAEFPPLR